MFAALVRLLTGARVTDTSSGYRAMRAESPRLCARAGAVPDPELLIGAILPGYRVAERPIVMRSRIAGRSKKGNNLSYGARYAGVILATWWRERRAPQSAR